MYLHSLNVEQILADEESAAYTFALAFELCALYTRRRSGSGTETEGPRPGPDTMRESKGGGNRHARSACVHAWRPGDEQGGDVGDR